MTVHVIGGGLAGLAAALACSRAGHAVVLYEAAPMLGGRCRTFRDPRWGLDLDNGTHAVVAANRATLDYLDEIGSRATLVAPDPRGVALFDARGGTRAVVPTGRPGWMLRPAVWQSFATAALNTPLPTADWVLAARTAWIMFATPGASPAPLVARASLAATFVDPAVAELRRRGASVHAGASVAAVEHADGRIVALTVAGARVAVAAEDAVISAVPPWSPLARALGLADERLAAAPIVNTHYLLSPDLADAAPAFVGLLNSPVQWVLRRGRVVTVTVSAADAWLARRDDEIAAALWPDAARALGLGAGPRPDARVVKERRATLRHTRASRGGRPGPRAGIANLAIAGDWTATGLPCTIDGAICSGRRAAALIAPAAGGRA